VFDREIILCQKSSTVAKIVSTLKKNDAMEYTIVMSASASEPAPVQYIAPYAGTAIAEYFVSQGKECLPGLPAADDQFTLTASDGEHRVNGKDTGL